MKVRFEEPVVAKKDEVVKAAPVHQEEQPLTWDFLGGSSVSSQPSS